MNFKTLHILYYYIIKLLLYSLSNLILDIIFKTGFDLGIWVLETGA